MRDYTDCYAILGLPPNSDWQTVRAQYRLLIRKWHPDRFAADSAQHSLAEERSKQITAAYRVLEVFHRDHGALPSAGPAVPPMDGRGPAQDAGSTYDGGVFQGISEFGARGPDVRVPATRRAGRGRRVVFALFALFAALYIGHRYLDAWLPDNSHADDDVPEPAVASQAAPVAESAGVQRGISAGSTFGDVYVIQGIPTSTQGDTWHYGKSHIRFAHGKVISWNEDPENPLRIARNQPAQFIGGHFKVGSTKDEVRATQGTPVTETAAVWDYGLSRVYFENNRVIRWEESPMQPLRVPHR